MVCTSSSPCHIKRVYIENNADGAKYKGELCGGCSWWKDKEPDPAPSPTPCPDSLCLVDITEPTLCQDCPSQPEQHADVAARPTRPGWGGSRRGAGAPKGSLNHLKHGKRSALIARAVDILAENKELRPFLLLIARAAVTGEIPQTTKKLIMQSLGKTSTGMMTATIQLRRLRDGQKV